MPRSNLRERKTNLEIAQKVQRSIITRHHTATHIVNGACRSVLGPWVWQHSAFKDVDMGRLDITHFSHLTREDVTAIEKLANEIVRRNLPVVIKWVPRIEAEQQYGFRLYQGGVAPVKDLRIVNIEGFDIEACGGTHVKSTGEIGMIKITKTERIQDGVERLEFVAGGVAVGYIESQEHLLMESAASLETPIEKIPATISHLKAEAENSKRNAKQLAKRLAEISLVEVPKLSSNLKDGLKLYASIFESGLDSEYHLMMGDRACIQNSDLVYVGLFEEGSRTRLIVFSGEIAQTKGVRAGAIVREIAKVMGGSGGGNNRFAQGGVDNRPEVIPNLPILINSFIGSK